MTWRFFDMFFEFWYDYTNNRVFYNSKYKGGLTDLSNHLNNIAPEGCLGVYVVGTARKAWFVHKDSPWEDYQPGFKIIVR